MKKLFFSLTCTILFLLHLICSSLFNMPAHNMVPYTPQIQNCAVPSVATLLKTTNTNSASPTAKKYKVAKTYYLSPVDNYAAGSKLSVCVAAVAKATVTATLDGKKIKLKPAAASGNDLTKFRGTFTLPSGHFKDKNLGKIKIKATYKGNTETFTTKEIICKKEKIVKSSDKKATPTDKNYINVGSGVITEIVAASAETFNGTSKGDTSKPANNYLPKGTVDYGSTSYETVKRDGKSLKLITLRCGKKVYQAHYDSPNNKKLTVAKQYVGKLPDHNELDFSAFKCGATHTTLRLDTLWKAPFRFELKKQTYNSDYSVDNVTFSYIDITFCYATKFEGGVIVPENPIFSKAKLIKNESDYTLRLYLKEKGAFYGWDSYYDAEGRLYFRFLNPAKVSKSDNKYGADLSNTRILIDVGHGGSDGGAVGLGSNKKAEAEYNLILAKKLKKELEKAGATIYLTRTDDSQSTANTKLKILRNLKPDFCIAIHHDSNDYSSLNGFGAYYYHPFSKNAAEFVANAADKKIYKNIRFKRHFYYMSRCAVCPVVLTENGYMTNSYDFGKIKSSAVATQKAEDLATGIVKYFKSIQ